MTIKGILNKEPKYMFKMAVIYAVIALIWFAIFGILVNNTDISESEVFPIFLPIYILFWTISGSYLVLFFVNKFFARKLIYKLDISSLDKKKKLMDLGVISVQEYTDEVESFKKKYTDFTN
ncbi:MAG: hypothetical protein ACQERD_08290 [Campylobacterota bacterium]